MKHGEVVWILLGNTGTNIGQETFETFRRDHGLGLDCSTEGGDLTNALYRENEGGGQFTPRVILVDTDPNHILDIKHGQARHLFLNSNYVTGTESTGSLYPVGLHSKLGPTVMNKIRQELEECDALQGIVMMYSYGGGTGSGLGTYVSTQLPSKATQTHFCLTPNPMLNAMSGGPLEPYNTGLTLYKTKFIKSCSIIAENDALYRVSEKKSLMSSTSQAWINRQLAQAISNVSAGWRISGGSPIRMGDLTTNLVVSQTMKFSTLSYSPLYTKFAEYGVLTPQELIRSLFEPGCYFINCEPRSGQIASCIICRGPDFGPLEVNQVLMELKLRGGICFARWAPQAIKVGVSPHPPAEYPDWSAPRSATLVTNTRALRPTWGQVEWNFNTLLGRRAFLHWYLLEGMEMDDFLETRELLAYLVDMYCQN